MQRGSVDIYHYQPPVIYSPPPPIVQHSQPAPVYQPPPDVPAFYEPPQPEPPQQHAQEWLSQGHDEEGSHEEFVENRVGREYTYHESFYHEQPMGAKEEKEMHSEVQHLQVFQQALQRFEEQVQNEASSDTQSDLEPEQLVADDSSQLTATDTPEDINVEAISDDVAPSDGQVREQEESETESDDLDEKENVPPPIIDEPEVFTMPA